MLLESHLTVTSDFFPGFVSEFPSNTPLRISSKTSTKDFFNSTLQRLLMIVSLEILQRTQIIPGIPLGIFPGISLEIVEGMFHENYLEVSPEIPVRNTDFLKWLVQEGLLQENVLNYSGGNSPGILLKSSQEIPLRNPSVSTQGVSPSMYYSQSII